jgi:hypothetical protein
MPQAKTVAAECHSAPIGSDSPREYANLGFQSGLPPLAPALSQCRRCSSRKRFSMFSRGRAASSLAWRSASVGSVLPYTKQSAAPRIPRGRTSERGASGAGFFGTSRCIKRMPSRWHGLSSARAASMNATRGTADASGDLPPAGDQSPNFNAVLQVGERQWWFGGYGLDPLEALALTDGPARTDY